MSTDEYTCSQDESGTFPVGYELCIDPDRTLCKGSDTGDISDAPLCWIIDGETIHGDTNSGEMGYDIALGGDVLAVGKPIIDSIFVFDRDGSQFIFHVSLPTAESGDRFGGSVSVATPGFAAGTPNKKLSAVVTVAGKRMVKIFEWLDDKTIWSNITHIGLSLSNWTAEGVPSVTLHQEGYVLAVQ